MKKQRSYNYQKRAYKAELLQWDGTNLDAVSAELRELGYDSLDIERGTIMARGKGKSLLCVAEGNWLRFGENGSFKIMRPDEAATYVPIQIDDDLRAENAALRAELDALKSVMHYPECWDVAAYQNITYAAAEVFKCSECGPISTTPKGMALVPDRLTAENGAKAALCGEKFADEYVSWSAIKEIHKAVVALFAAAQKG